MNIKLLGSISISHTSSSRPTPVDLLKFALRKIPSKQRIWAIWVTQHRLNVTNYVAKCVALSSRCLNNKRIRMDTGGAFQKAGLDIEKTLHPVFVIVRGTANSSGLTWASLKFWRNVLVSMLIMSVMGLIIMSRHFFNTLVGMGSRSHDCDDELKISFLISSSGARLKLLFWIKFMFFDLITRGCDSTFNYD